jgi:hypothetical protein
MSYFDDNEEYFTGERLMNKMSKNYQRRDLNDDSEFVDGMLLEGPYFRTTATGKRVCLAKIETENEELSIVAWEDNAETLNNLNKGNKIIISGYRKFNDYLNKEEFVIKYFVKKGE